MDEQDVLAGRFAENRSHLRAVAYRMLGSLTEADDAVQEAWIRLSRADTSEVDNLRGWLTTVVARVCLDMLRTRKSRREELHGSYFPEPLIDREDSQNPEHEALLADSVGLALLVVLEALTPAERLSFVLHDMFAVPFDDIAPIVGRTPAAVRQLASRGRRRVRGSAVPDADVSRQREVVDAFLTAARGGDFQALVTILDPDVTLRAAMPTGVIEVHGAETVAKQAAMFWQLLGPSVDIRPVLVNGVAGLVAMRKAKPYSVLAFTVTDGRVAAMDIVNDRARLAALDLG
ncbi:sigma-70 family RNA polymerase sigma factor [Fodinicola acaciae]|uniref:sigma-70 family RNA polymerase sigma factor n=1 Tax=Fodinicola acaciae TaxID=2681555 RepID=UPI0013D6C9A9|nr:sigma-70 family RNA polymerase sigma factor [Fodinicola acaciae]